MSLASDTPRESKSGLDDRAFLVILVFVTAIAAAAMWCAGAVVTFRFQGICGEPATAADLHAGRTWLSVLTGLSALLWAVVALRTRRPWLVAAAGLIASAPAAYFTLVAYTSSAAEWTNPWCLF